MLLFNAWAELKFEAVWSIFLGVVTMNNDLLLVLAIFLAGTGVVLLGIGLRWYAAHRFDERMRGLIGDDQTEPDEKSVSRSLLLQNRDLTGSFVQRVIIPPVRKILNILGQLSPAGTVESLRTQLIIAGTPLGLGPREFFSIRIIFVAAGLVLFIFFFQLGLNQINLITGLALLFFCFYSPLLWLRGRVRYRQNLIRLGLPDALDLLTVCSSAGLGFDQSLQRVSEHLKTPVAIELGRVTAEMDMGLSRKEALKNLADRLQVNELTSFVSFIIQSDQLGMSISDTLLAQADQMRMDRRFRAQEQAQRIPTKMLFPMVLLIFPALLAIILGPAMPRLLGYLRAF